MTPRAERDSFGITPLSIPLFLNLILFVFCTYFPLFACVYLSLSCTNCIFINQWYVSRKANNAEALYKSKQQQQQKDQLFKVKLLIHGSEVRIKKTFVRNVKPWESRQEILYFQKAAPTEGAKIIAALCFISRARGPRYTLKYLSDDQTVSEIHLSQLIISMQSDKHTHFMQ